MDKPMNRIKEVLEERGIKQTWLAERLGKSFCIGKVEIEKSRISTLGEIVSSSIIKTYKYE